MRNPVRPLFAFLALAMVLLACAVEIPPLNLPGATPVGGTVVPPASPDPNDLGTAVAGTLTASVPGPVDGSPTDPAATPPPVEGAEILPRTLYYTAPDAAGLTQIFRLEQDGVTQTQITTESSSVTDYDVSQVDGSVA